MKFLYNIGIRAYGLGVATAGLLGKQKAVQWLEGRRNWSEKLKEKNWNSPIWVHASSLGEFEQAKPLIEKIKAKDLKQQILVTFFSPSGYEPSKDYKLADGVFYLPLDTSKNAAFFLDIVRPKLAIFVKYDFWFNFLKVLQTQQIPTLFFSCNFRESQMYFKSSTEWQRDVMRKIDAIYCLNEASKSVLKNHNFTNAKICGDTRFDKVIQNAERITPVDLISEYKGVDELLILGSSWPEEEIVLESFWKTAPDNLKVIIAPHDICEAHLQEIENRFPNKTIRYSKLNNENVGTTNIILIDSIGLLANLYQYGDIAFVGGGFTNDLHNILEPCAMLNALIYGDVISKYPEGQELIDFGGGFAVSNEVDFAKKLNLLLADKTMLDSKKRLCKEFVYQHKGATEVVFEGVSELLV